MTEKFRVIKHLPNSQMKPGLMVECDSDTYCKIDGINVNNATYFKRVLPQEIIEYPILLEHQEVPGLVVLFTSRDTGTIIKTPNRQLYPLGSYSESWVIRLFKPYKRTVKIKNKSVLNYELKSVDIAFNEIKDCKLSTLRRITLEEIADSWTLLLGHSNNEGQSMNEDIKTIKHFVENPELLKNEVLVYNDKGLADGYHRLTAMVIVGQKSFKYIIDNTNLY